MARKRGKKRKENKQYNSKKCKRSKLDDVQSLIEEKKSSDGVVNGSCDEKGDLTILLIGSNGAGKSATGNSILREEHFLSKPSSRTVTLESEKRACNWDGRRLIIVDTPGFLNSNKSEEEIRSEVKCCLQLCASGPNAIVLVLQTGRFTKVEREAVQRVQDLFGTNVLKQMVIVFSRKDDLEDKTIEEFVSEAEPSLKELIKKCGSRYCAFNNRATGEENNKQVSFLITIIEKMISAEVLSPIWKVLRNVMNKGMAIGAGLGLASGVAVPAYGGWQYLFLAGLMPGLFGLLGGVVWCSCI